MDGLSKKPKYRPVSASTGTIDKSLQETTKDVSWQDDSFAKNTPEERETESGKTFQRKSRQKSPTKRHFHFPWKIAIKLAFTFFLAWGCFLGWQVVRAGRVMHIDTADIPKTSLSRQIQSVATSLITHQYPALRGEESGRINILLLGKAGKQDAGRDLTDTIMMASIDTKDNKVSLLSLPRDLYVRIPDSTSFSKINSVYRYGLNQSQDKGLENIEQTVERILDQPIHYVLILDFAGFEKIIDALGGINIEVLRDIYDPRYPGPNYSYETFEIKKGWQTLDGKTALKYVRERHDDPEGDFGRAKRQQQVIQAAKNKAFSAKTFLDPFAINDLIGALGESIQTTVSPEEFPAFINLAKKLDTNNINNVVVDAWKPESLLRVSHVMVGSVRAFILLPRTGNYREIQDTAANIFHLNAIQRRKQAIQDENPTIAVIDRTTGTRTVAKIQKLLRESFGFKNVDIIHPKDKSVAQESLVTDLSGKQKPFALDEVLKMLPDIELRKESALDTVDTALFENTDQEDMPDFVLSIGDDLKESLDYEEVSAEEFRDAPDDFPDNLVE